MNFIKSLGLVGLAATSLFAAQAFATPCANAPATGNPTQGSPTCVAPVGLDGAGTGLQDLLNGITKPTTPLIDVYNDQYVPDSHWSVGSLGISGNRLLFEIAGNANINSFGIYDLSNPSNRLTIFDGAANPYAATILFYGNSGTGSYTVGSTTKIFGSGSLFGYYLQTANGPTFFSDMLLNSDAWDHMLAYQGNGVTQLDTHGTGYAPFLTNEWLLAWEDLPYSSSDLDYNDMVVMVESVTPVPEPAALGMFGLGVLLIGGFVALRRRSLNA